MIDPNYVPEYFKKYFSQHDTSRLECVEVNDDRLFEIRGRDQNGYPLCNHDGLIVVEQVQFDPDESAESVFAKVADAIAKVRRWEVV